MLSYFDSITVPGLEKITVYRDDEDAFRFYVMPSTPRLARDDDGRLLLDLMIYARDVDKLPPEDLEAQRGWIAASVELRLTDEEERKVRDYLKTLINGGGNAFFAQILGLTMGASEPKITLPPEWVDGTVLLTIPTPGGTTSVSTSKPSLISTNVATLAGDLSQDASELLRQSVLAGGLPLAAMYNDLSFVARIPAITVRIHGDRSAFLSETISRYQVEHHIEHTETVDFLFWEWTYRYWETYTTQHTSVSEFQNTVQSIRLEIDDSDFRDLPAAQEAKAKFEEMAIKIFAETVVPSIMQDVSKQFDAAKAQLVGADPKAPPPPCSVQQLTSQITGTVDINLSKTSVIQVKKNPNGALGKDLTAEEIKSAVTYVDLSDPYFKEMRLRVHANVNFAQDPVYQLKVFVLYDQLDDKIPRAVKGSKTMAFNSADQVQTFRQILARDKDGKTKDTYSYWSEIIYKETGETIRVPAAGSIEATDTELVISYRSLGFVKVLLALAPLPTEIVSVRVAVTYPRSNAATASQTVELSTAKPTATFFTYTGHAGEPDPYTYDITYVLSDGQQMTTGPQSGRAETLTIGNPFEDRVTTTFVAQADFSLVDKVIVDAVYADTVHDLHLDHHAELTSNGASSPWEANLRDPQKLDFTYKTTVLYKNGSTQQAGPTPGRLGETVLAGVGAADALEVLLVPNIDAAHKSAVVQLEYTDAAHQVHQAQNFVIDNNTASTTFKVLLRDPTKRTYRYRIQLMSPDPASAWDSGWQESSDSVLMVQKAPSTIVMDAPPAPAPAPTPPSG